MKSNRQGAAYRNFQRNKDHSKHVKKEVRVIGSRQAIIVPVLVSVITSVAVAILLNPSGILKSWNDLPEERDRAEALNRGAADLAWSGTWSTVAEGYVNRANVHDRFVEIELETHRGAIEGAISAAALCEAFPISQEWLVDGRASTDRAWLMLYDYREGERIELRQPDAEYSLFVAISDDDPTVVKVLDEKMWGLIPQGVAIRLHPVDQVSPSGAREDFNSSCDTLRTLERNKHILDPGYREHLDSRRPQEAPKL